MTNSKVAQTNSGILTIYAALLLATIPSIASADSWELRTTPKAVPGTHEIESGEIDKAIRLSNAWLTHVAREKKVAVLNNLCIAYILRKKFDMAEGFCDQAVERPNNKAVSYNNRGVLRAMQGDYEGAVRDFAQAANRDCDDDCASSAPNSSQHPRAIAMRNLDRGEYQVKAASADNGEEVAARTN